MYIKVFTEECFNGCDYRSTDEFGTPICIWGKTIKKLIPKKGKPIIHCNLIKEKRGK